jgi:lysine 2,3-aminomutase
LGAGGVFEPWESDMSDASERVTDGIGPTPVRPKRDVGMAQASEQPFEYPLQREYVEPDWTRLPGYADVTREEWESAKWQRSHSVKTLAEFQRAFGEHLDDNLCADLERDQRERATMSMLIPPHMINTMDERNM